MSISKNSPIGIFDSGIGGLTVVKSVMEALPNEHITYFGDTARVPYGIKSAETVRQYALQITDFLLKKNVKCILIACNTVASAAVSQIIKRCGDLPVLDVITAGTIEAVKNSKTHNKIGVIGTLGTINSGTYEKKLQDLDPNIRVFSRACPLLVPLAEEGWTDNEISEKVLETYLNDVKQQDLDSLILGCTHYPLFKSTIKKVLNDSGIGIIDSADSIASMTKSMLTEQNLLNEESNTGTFECFVSDKPQRFQILAERFLGKKLTRVDIVSLNQ